ncbi:hypothetical protein SteCoe_36364 [Stentor coeruleus]|uniref:C3H1-type domain-containing protein n=1 Tax=Stentor coeruleus TaxID=5963 RepID=A0A1R2AQA7_9CILI|nr:hypothetical protein SteCoe_36364 [Stentor coeruleus]
MKPNTTNTGKKEIFKGYDIGYKYYSKDSSQYRQESQSKFKTELCRNLESGFCEFGDKCFFAHSIEELRDKSYLTVQKHAKCKSFFEIGYCIMGRKCEFSHRDYSPETAANSPNISKRASRKCSEDTHKPQLFTDFESRRFH